MGDIKGISRVDKPASVITPNLKITVVKRAIKR